jgi:PAS domain S-box-containing protein
MTGRIRVLLVEDNQADVDLIREMLPETGAICFQIESVPRLSDALVRLKGGDVDLVLLDLGLPDSQGISTFQAVRKAALDVPIIVFTGNADQELAVTAVKEGAQDYLVKGEVVGNVVMRAARYAIERKQAKDAMQQEIAKAEASRQTLLSVVENQKRTENQLRQSEEKFSKAFQTSPYAITITRAEDGGFIEVNDAFTSIAGFTREEALADSSIGLKLWVDGEARKRVVDDLLAGKIVNGHEYRFRTKSGKVITGLFSAQIIKLSGILCILSSINDITERRLAQDQLQKTSQDLDTLMSNLYAGILSTSKDGEVEHVNQAFCDLFNLSEMPADLQGLSSTEMLKKIASSYADPAKTLSRIREVIALGKPVKGEEIVMRDGRFFLVDFIPIIDKDGNNCGRIWHHHNITDRKRAEQSLAESEKKLRVLFETMSEGIVYEDHNGSIISANLAAERLLGLSLDQLQGRTSLDPRWKAIHEDGSPFPGETHSLHVAAKTGKPTTGEVMGVYNPHLDAYVWLNVNSTPEFLPGESKPFRAYAVFRDITGFKRAEDALRQSEEKFSKAFQTSPYAISITHIEDGRFVEVNDAFVSLTGFTRDETLADSSIGLKLWADENDRRRIVNDLNAGRTVAGREYRFRTKTGKIVVGLYSAQTIRLNLGRCILSSINDISERTRTADLLKKSEEKFRNVFDNSPIGKSITTLEGQINVNKAFCDLIGYSKEALVDIKWQQITFPDDCELTQRHIEQLLAGKEGSARFIKRYIHKNGDVIWTDVSTALQRDEDGNPLYFITSLVDITDRKRAEDALRASELRYRRLFEAAKDGILILDAETGMIIDVNPFLTEMLGFSHEQFTGKSVWELGFLKDIIANRENFLELQQKEYIRYEDLPLKTADGRSIDVEFVSNVYLIDRRKVIQCNIRDITERKRAVLQLESNYALLAALINSPRDLVIFSLDKEYRYSAFNDKHREEMKKVWAADIKIGDNILDYMNDPELRTAAKASMDHALRGETFTEIKHQPQVDIFYEFIWNPVYLKKKVVGITAFIRDITERKQAETVQQRLMAELTQKNGEMEQLIYVASHDLRSPLVNIQGFSKEIGFLVNELAEITAHAVLPDKQRARIIEIVSKDFPEVHNYILASVIKMDMLLKGLLKFSRLGRATVSIQKIDMNEMMSSVLKTSEFQIQRSGACVTITALPPCSGDPVQVNQVFTNLLDNAIKYLSPDRPGVILITGKSENGISEYSVEDNGIGIAPEHHTKVFEIFHRLNPQTNEGEGLGLAIVKKIVSRLNGRVRLESEAGKGCRFFVSLPEG